MKEETLQAAKSLVEAAERSLAARLTNLAVTCLTQAVSLLVETIPQAPTSHGVKRFADDLLAATGKPASETIQEVQDALATIYFTCRRAADLTNAEGVTELARNCALVDQFFLLVRDFLSVEALE